MKSVSVTISAIAVACAVSGAMAADPYKINVIVPLTGPAAFVGQAQQQSLKVFQTSLNKQGGIKGQPIEFIFHDDQTKPQLTVQLTNQIMADKPAVMIGGGISALCNAINPKVVAGPFTYCMTPAVHPDSKSFQYASSTDSHALIQVLVRYFRLKGLTRIAFITSTDATGQDAEKGIDTVLALPENAEVKATTRQRFNTTEVSISAQVERIKESQPQAVIAWSTGAPISTVFKGLILGGVDIPIGTTNANQTYAQMEQSKGFLPKQLFIPTSLFLKHEGKFKLDPRVEEEQLKFYAAFKESGVRPDAMSTMSWDPALLIVEALRAVGTTATAEQLKQYVDAQTELVGINGLYNFKQVPQRGLTVDNALVSRWDETEGTWLVVSKPTGVPLAD